MWHWNSLWAPAPGDPPAVDDPKLYQSPWAPEHLLIVQARAWDTWVSSSRAWWSFWLASLPMPTAPSDGSATDGTAPWQPDAPPPEVTAEDAADADGDEAAAGEDAGREEEETPPPDEVYAEEVVAEEEEPEPVSRATPRRAVPRKRAGRG